MLEEYDVEGIPVDEVRNNSIVEGTHDFKSHLLRGLIHGHGSVNDEVPRHVESQFRLEIEGIKLS